MSELAQLIKQLVALTADSRQQGSAQPGSAVSRWTLLETRLGLSMASETNRGQFEDRPRDLFRPNQRWLCSAKRGCSDEFSFVYVEVEWRVMCVLWWVDKAVKLVVVR